MQLVHAVVTVTLVLSPALVLAQSTNPLDYVLLAEDQLKTKQLNINGGNVGVNSPGGRFLSRGALKAPDAVIAADDVRLKSKGPVCGALVANTASGADGKCGPPTPFTQPFPDVATACGFPADLPDDCDTSLPPVVITLNQTMALPPGDYGVVEVQGGPKGNGRLELSGSYTFCSLKIERDALVVPTGPTELRVIDKLDVNKSSKLNPAGGVAADAFFVFVGGDTNFGKSTTARAILCAPNGRLSIDTAGAVEGRFYARVIGIKGSATFSGSTGGTTTSTTPPSSTSTSTSTTSSTSTSTSSTSSTTSTSTSSSTTSSTVETTSTTVETTSTTLETTSTTSTSSSTSTSSTTTPPPVCGNGIVDPGEVCDGDVPCDPSSPGGAFATCADDCLSLDDSACGAFTTTSTTPESTTTTLESTTTTLESTTTTLETTTTTLETTTTSSTSTSTSTSSSTSSSTIPPSLCGNGTVDPGEVCDGDVPCDPSSPGGAFATCADDCLSLDSSACGAFTTTSTAPESTTTSTTPETTTTSSTSTSTSTSSSSSTSIIATTTTTSLQPVCGNGIVEEGEACDGNVPCDPSSPGGAFATCAADCLTLDDSACGAFPTTTTSLATTSSTAQTTTTSTSSSSTTTPVGSTTTTTIVGPVCGDLVVEPGEICDGNVPCDPSSPGGAFAICAPDCSSLDTSACPGPVEICGNCIDDDGNDRIDFEDEACCLGLRSQQASVRRAAIKPRSQSNSFLRLRSRLSSAGTLKVNPKEDDVFLQLRQASGEVLCAWAPNEMFMRMRQGRVFKYWGLAESAQGVEDMKVTLRKNGQVRYRAFGKQVKFALPTDNVLEVTVGFRNSAAGDATNRCTAGVQAFRTTGSGALIVRRGR